VRGEDEGRAAALGAADKGDVLVRQVYAGVGLLDGRVVPVFDVAQRHADIDLARQLQIGIAGQVVA
jgi:hypothetical protein